MKTCDVCGNASFHEGAVDEVLRIQDRLVLVEHIPASICDRCGDATFDGDTYERIRTTLHENPQPTRHETLDVFAYSA